MRFIIFTRTTIYLYLSCNGNPNVDTVIRFSTQLKPVMIIYSEMPIDIVGFRENDINNRFNISPSIAANFSYVSQQILVLTKQTVTIQDDIFYEGTLTEGQIVNIIKFLMEEVEIFVYLGRFRQQIWIC